jgi:hypothetical protein
LFHAADVGRAVAIAVLRGAGHPGDDAGFVARAITVEVGLDPQLVALRPVCDRRALGGAVIVSPHDVDARRGKHGSFFSGYLLDVVMDADSQIITALDVLPANAGEAADATKLLSHEERVHDNDVQTLSIDKAGFRGDLLRAWQDQERLGLEVVVPPTSLEPRPARSDAQPTSARRSSFPRAV